MPESADFRPARADSRPGKADSRPEKADFRPEKVDFCPERPERAWRGMHEQMNGHQRSPVFTGHRSLWGRCPKKRKRTRRVIYGEAFETREEALALRRKGGKTELFMKRIV